MLGITLKPERKHSINKKDFCLTLKFEYNDGK